MGYEICMRLSLFVLQRSHRNPDCFTPLQSRTELFENSDVPFPVSDWNKLDHHIRNVDSYSLFRKNVSSFITFENSIFGIYDPLKIKFLNRLRLGFNHLREYKFRYNFANIVNPLYPCSLEIESTEHYRT